MRPLFLLFFLCTYLFAATSPFVGCKKKVRYSHAIDGATLRLSLENNKALVYSDVALTHYEKYDPFLSLYLLENPKPYAYPFKLFDKRPKKMAAVNASHYFHATITRHQVGLSRLALINRVVSAPSLLLGSCCSIQGLITARGVIEKPYIEHFLSSDGRYGDIGIRIDTRSKRVRVTHIDPFYPKNPFQHGDEIYAINKKPVSRPAEAMQQILFAPLDKKMTLHIKRQGKRYKVTLLPLQRHGGGAISDTFLERLGLFFDDELRLIKQSTRTLLLQGLRTGDQLLQVNGEPVYDDQDVRAAISEQSDAQMLFRRNGFDFFVRVPTAVEHKSAPFSFGGNHE